MVIYFFQNQKYKHCVLFMNTIGTDETIYTEINQSDSIF